MQFLSIIAQSNWESMNIRKTCELNIFVLKCSKRTPLKKKKKSLALGVYLLPCAAAVFFFKARSLPDFMGVLTGRSQCLKNKSLALSIDGHNHSNWVQNCQEHFTPLSVCFYCFYSFTCVNTSQEIRIYVYILIFLFSHLNDTVF